jgi:predicted dithiol-disulfide oxidoreductase (DUF899 family)
MYDIMHHTVVSHDEWLAARKQLLAEEKEFTRLRDRLSQRRRDLPWEAVDKEYVFEGPHGRQTLAELFDGRSQLIVYHAMFDPATSTLTTEFPSRPKKSPRRRPSTTTRCRIRGSPSARG